MQTLKRFLLFSTLFWGASLAQSDVNTTSSSAPAKLRGLWVDAFGAGFRTPLEVDQLIRDAQSMGINALFAQVVRRGDCYCNKASVPRTSDPAVTKGFDPLEDLLTKAHRAGIQVHAWMIATSIYTQNQPPLQKDHIYNLHGPNSNDSWLMSRVDGATKAGPDYLLDPGNPAAANYIAEMYRSVVQNYAVDGVQFDRIRYPDQNIPEFVPSWGYNPVAVKRFVEERGGPDKPDPSDPNWQDWRREQISALVRRVYLEVKAIRPSVWVSAAVITYGAGPADTLEWPSSRPYHELLQDWVGWLGENTLDLLTPMNYKRESVPEQSQWFEEWNAFIAGLDSQIPVAIGTALYLNSAGNSAKQVTSALEQWDFAGWVGYSYRFPTVESYQSGVKTSRALRNLKTSLSSLTQNPQPWIAAPTADFRGILGYLTDGGQPFSDAVVELLNGEEVVKTVRSDGNGYFGFSTLPEGVWSIRLLGSEKLQSVTLTPGKVTRVELKR